jgi:hypothetical protein
MVTKAWAWKKSQKQVPGSPGVCARRPPDRERHRVVKELKQPAAAITHVLRLPHRAGFYLRPATHQSAVAAVLKAMAHLLDFDLVQAKAAKQ